MTRKPSVDPARLPEGAIVEFIAMGRYVKVSAVDPRSGEEVCIVGDPKVGETVLTDLAVTKLLRRLKRPGRGAVVHDRAQDRTHEPAVSRPTAASAGMRGRRRDAPSGWDL